MYQIENTPKSDRKRPPYPRSAGRRAGAESGHGGLVDACRLAAAAPMDSEPTSGHVPLLLSMVTVARRLDDSELTFSEDRAVRIQ